MLIQRGPSERRQCHLAALAEHVQPVIAVLVPPTAAELVGLRMRHRRTQAAVAERSGVPPRQVQRWEAGEGTMPVASWQLLCREWGTRFREDFATAPGPMTRGWDTLRDTARDTIERGDVVHLQAIARPLIVATVCADRVHDGLVDEHAYGAIVTGLGWAPRIPLVSPQALLSASA
ncbi:helix-turn-helix domain-containing protein [Burkholderia cepacia]|uniref:helix-turn-helix domain-containing protein n=1 Tax=Burkholderia cepacia TaxID=292 RepID=UPI0038B7465A